jgi:hypothetical protein
MSKDKWEMVPAVTHLHVTNDACEFSSAFEVPAFLFRFSQFRFCFGPAVHILRIRC